MKLEDNRAAGLRKSCIVWAGFLVVASIICSHAAVTPRWLKPYSPKDGDEELIFTPPGFTAVGKPAIAKGPDVAELNVTIRSEVTGKPTFCRVNVVGEDGHFYQPQRSRLTDYSLTGMWPKQLAGNRPGKAPIRYFGRFFYTDGTFKIFVPPGKVRIEVWKGLEYQQFPKDLNVDAKEQREVELAIERTVDMSDLGYYSGDLHLHFDRINDEDDETILDLLEAEDVRYGGVMCYNGTSSYQGTMDKQGIPQMRGLGKSSLRSRGDYQIISGQEYRSVHYGHTKVFLSDEMVQAGKSYDPNQWPVFGEALQIQRDAGAVAFWAHGGYSKEIFADVPLGKVDGVELLQFGIYRPIGLEGWYKALNMGFRFPALGASDYPACRKLCDSITYVHSEEKPTMEQWIRAAAEGRSFMTTGPLLLLEVDGKQPGDTIRGRDKVQVNVRLRAFSQATPINHIDLIVNGKVNKVLRFAPVQGRWMEARKNLELEESSWIAASAYSLAKSGSPDAESHTNPVYVYLGDRKPYVEEDLDWWLEQLDTRIAHHSARKLGANRDQILVYFNNARKRLLEIREAKGMGDK
tara:strand:+ start:5685 stop:7412 length:1728 start_codon:yes stop_codon:yes gene_type:complete